MSQLQMHHARCQGDAFGAASEQMAARSDTALEEKRAGDYWVGCYVAAARGCYEWTHPDAATEAELVWHEPRVNDTHIAITVRDGGDGRFIPVARVTVTAVGENGAVLGVRDHPLRWDPLLYHYGRNWTVPEEGIHALRVRVDPPTFARYDQINGKRLCQAVEVEFPGLRLSPGLSGAGSLRR